MKKVIILKVEDYNFDILKERLKEAIFKHFSVEKLFSNQDKILLKPNLLMESRPEEAITTHPVFIAAVGMILKELGFKVAVADSPGGFASDRDMDFIYERTGIKEVAASFGFDLLYPTKSFIRQGLPLCWWLEGYKMINLPKLKTHDIMILTLAAKNLYGCISGLHKSHLHKVYTKSEDFSGVVLKLYKEIKPSLNIVDGILALEGHGPAKSGRPKKTGVVVLGDDALYTDYVIAKVMGLSEANNPLIRQAKREGLISEEDLEVISEIEPGHFKDFKFPLPFIVDYLPAPLISCVKPFLKFKPAINSKKCCGCAKCKEICPQAAIEINDGHAVIDYSKCIMCMCCSEVCRFAAVQLSRGFLLDSLKKARKCFR